MHFDHLLLINLKISTSPSCTVTQLVHIAAVAATTASAASGILATHFSPEEPRIQLMETQTLHHIPSMAETISLNYVRFHLLFSLSACFALMQTICRCPRSFRLRQLHTPTLCRLSSDQLSTAVATTACVTGVWPDYPRPVSIRHSR